MSSRSADLCDGDHEEEEEEGEGCVPIPELPSGRKLTVVILTTWGDQYYVGLNSIEVFTASGEMADIQKVSFCNQAAIFCRQKPKHTQCFGPQYSDVPSGPDLCRPSRHQRSSGVLQ